MKLVSIHEISDLNVHDFKVNFISICVNFSLQNHVGFDRQLCRYELRCYVTKHVWTGEGALNGFGNRA